MCDHSLTEQSKVSASGFGARKAAELTFFKVLLDLLVKYPPCSFVYKRPLEMHPAICSCNRCVNPTLFNIVCFLCLLEPYFPLLDLTGARNEGFALQATRLMAPTIVSAGMLVGLAIFWVIVAQSWHVCVSGELLGNRCACDVMRLRCSAFVHCRSEAWE